MSINAEFHGDSENGLRFHVCLIVWDILWKWINLSKYFEIVCSNIFIFTIFPKLLNVHGIRYHFRNQHEILRWWTCNSTISVTTNHWFHRLLPLFTGIISVCMSPLAQPKPFIANTWNFAHTLPMTSRENGIFCFSITFFPFFYKKKTLPKRPKMVVFDITSDLIDIEP